MSTSSTKRLPEAARLHAMVTAHEHGHDDDCRCRYGRKIDAAISEAVEALNDQWDALVARCAAGLMTETEVIQHMNGLFEAAYVE